MRCVHEFSSILDKSIRPYLSKCNHSWRVDETYIKIKGKWTYLYRAVDSKGNTIDFYLSKNIEVMNMLRKGQVNFKNYSVLIEVEFINSIMGITA